MTDRRSIFATLCVAALAPVAAHAAGGVIHFKGAIVEPARCQVQVGGPPEAARAYVSCGVLTGGKVAEPASVVAIRTQTVVLKQDASGKPGRGYIVTLNYL